MATDVTGILLIPGNNGDNCFGNGKHTDKNGTIIECCCDECDYFLDCFPVFIQEGTHRTRMEIRKK